MKRVSLTFLLTTIFALAIAFPQTARSGVGDYEEVVGGIVNYHETKFQDDPRKIYIVNKRTGDRRLIYESPKSYVDWISVSPNREFIAGIEPEDSTKNRLLIIDPEGNIMHSIVDDVRKYDWSPDGNSIAYITGTYDEDVGFRATGLYVFDLEDGSKKQIAPRAHYVNWASFDGCIYFNDLRKVFKYDPVTAKTEETPYYGVNFSPDGRYYTTDSPELTYQVYSTETNQPVTERLSARFKDLRFSPTWVPDQKHYLQIVKVDFIVDPVIPGRRGGIILGVKQKKYTIYDIETDQIIKEWIEKPEE